jgi:hypothetical protein
MMATPSTVRVDTVLSGKWSGPRADDLLDQLKLEPQPHVRVAFGFVMAKPAPCRPSL